MLPARLSDTRGTDVRVLGVEPWRPLPPRLRAVSFDSAEMELGIVPVTLLLGSAMDTTWLLAKSLDAHTTPCQPELHGSDDVSAYPDQPGNDVNRNGKTTNDVGTELFSRQRYC